VPRWLDDEEQQAWRGWLDLNAQISAAMHRGLQATSGLSLADYDVLVALTDVPEQSLRMYELGRKLGWEKSRVSKQVSRMAARDLVVRRECEDDLRGAFVDLREAGLAAIRKAAPAHVDLVRRLVFDGLSRAQVSDLASLTRGLLDRISLEYPDDGRTGSGARDASGQGSDGGGRPPRDPGRGKPSRAASGHARGDRVGRGSG
jgi:DNA-binding MarR family transcriptional regulator